MEYFLFIHPSDTEIKEKADSAKKGLIHLPSATCFSTFQAWGRLAQLVRAPRLHRGGRGFESLAVYHFKFEPWGSTIMRHIISILVENKFGVLARISGMFSGRGFNIETLNVGPMIDDRFSRITATIVGDNEALDQVIKQVNKFINVLDVTEFSSGQATERELEYTHNSSFSLCNGVR